MSSRDVRFFKGGYRPEGITKKQHPRDCAVACPEFRASKGFHFYSGVVGNGSSVLRHFPIINQLQEIDTLVPGACSQSIGVRVGTRARRDLPSLLQNPQAISRTEV